MQLTICLASLTAALLIGSWSATTTPMTDQVSPFDEAVIFVEYNATDADAEVVVVIDANVGLDSFWVVAPDGKEVLKLRAETGVDIGIRKINLETPEPSLAEVLMAYPSGFYQFFGRSVDGEHLFSSAFLSHDLPAAPHLIYPVEGAVGVPSSGAAASWTAGPDAESFFLELEQDELEEDVKSNMAASKTTFGFPEGWLEGNTEYQLGIAARAGNGNLTVVEIHFTTGS